MYSLFIINLLVIEMITLTISLYIVRQPFPSNLFLLFVCFYAKTMSLSSITNKKLSGMYTVVTTY